MAPVKNPNTTNKVTTNHSSQSHNSIPPPATANNNTTNCYSANTTPTQRKQTGTVPKASTKSSTNASGTKPLLQPSGIGQKANRCSPLNIVASIQHQQQQHHPRTHQHKNTEIVAPIRRELKDLNDYLLTTVVTTTSNNNLNNNQQQQHLHQLQTTIAQHQQQQQQSSINTTATNSDFESSQDNQQRFCYPVRPIPRRNQQQSQQHNNPQSQGDFLNSCQNSNLNTAIGVVIPTTPGLPTASNAATTQSLTTVQPISSNTNTTQSENSLLGQQFEQHLQLLLVQRLKQLFENSQSQPLLNLTTNFLPNIQSSTSANLANAVLNHNTNEFNPLPQRFQQSLNSCNSNNNHKTNLENSLQSQQKALKSSVMVHEIPPNSTPRDIVVNSTSLEDVPLSETSDRAQSIQSLHSNIETPTPDNTPSYEELQQRLEASNRNIQNMQEQQQQLLKLQNAAKQHLSDMEKLRQQAQPLSFPTGSQRGADGSDGTPDYQSIDQVHSDMAALVGRMKNLTTFIHNQNELSSLMGDDGPEILAEQELLQRKLEALRAQRDEMRNIVSELQSVNRSAEETAKEARQRQYEQEKDIEENVQSSDKGLMCSKKPSNVDREREVPIEYSRNVQIEVLQEVQRQQTANTNGHIQSESETEGEPGAADNEEERKVAAALIQQKVADIDAMKAQLKRLKDMMETVNIIEAHTAKDPKLVGDTSSREIPIRYDRERTLEATPNRYQDANNTDELIARKVRMLNEVTSDLRAQAQSLQSEKDRIQALKNEIERCKQQAAAAAQMGEEALKRSSLTPTPIPRIQEIRWDVHVETQNERDQLKEEYELKKKEFELLCKQLEQEDQQPTTTRSQDVVSEADDEAEEDNNDSDYTASNKFVTASTAAGKRTSDQASRNVKDSLNSIGASSNAATHIAQAASSTHDGASLEAASMQSGSSRSYSIPPPMSAMGMNFPGPMPPPLPTAWNPHQYYYATGVPPPPPLPQTSFGISHTSNVNAPTLSNTECICNANNLGAATSSSTATSAATNAPMVSTDPMLQQFIQTQQMLISSVCQCHQMLWHQQREIDNLNQIIHVLQERLLSITAGNINTTSNANDVGYSLRSESVPPPSLSGLPTNQALPNNLYVGVNRSQSEQPIPFLPGQNRNSAFNNYHHQQQHQHIYRHQRMAHPQTIFNFTSESQQHNTSATAATSTMYATLNNAIPQPQQVSSTHFNNEIPTGQSPAVGSGPAPIFMHHHNNAIHQNNANLRTQNQQQQHHHHSNISHTLNNQVPPGNRANNYWDNFRSYSRQNLLSTNSAKSNEEQQIQQHQQQETPFERATAIPHQQPQHDNYNFQEQNQNLAECSNNLNFAPNNESASAAQNKYLRIIQRSRINQQQQQQYQQNVYQQQRDFLQQLNWLEEHENTTNNTNSTNVGSNTADLVYNNYNIHQSNKVGPKPNWSFRNLNEEYNNPTGIQNGRHSAQPLQRYQNTFQEQQHHQALQHFLNRQQHPQSTTAIQARNQDFLLRPAVDLDIREANYNFLNTQQQLPFPFSHPEQHNNESMILNTNENNEDDDEEEDDTTSEEIKRNLLVNALKNDKFTTKFYESIKEDVFRRLESMLLDKDNINNETAGQQNLLFNNISNISLRKLNLNEQRDQLLQQQQQLQSHLDNTAGQNLKEDLQISTAVIDTNEAEPNLSSSNNDNDNENEKPEEDTNWRESERNNCNNPNQTVRSNVITNATGNNTSAGKNVTKKRKNLRKQSLNQTNVNVSNNEEDGTDNLRGACSLAAQQHQKLQQEIKCKQDDNKNETNNTSSANSPKSSVSASVAITKQQHSTEYDFIKYIITRIRNQTHTNTLVNDALLVDVAKLTATVASNAQPLVHNINLGNNASNISPKKIYAKIKKLSLPKERDEFLRWYQKYLENTLFSNHRHQLTTDKGKSSAKNANNQQDQQQQQKDLPTLPNDDGDLAEADQNCSLNNSGGSCVLTSNDISSTYCQTFDENKAQSCALILNKTESSNGSVEHENNENPDEAHSLDVLNNRESPHILNSAIISDCGNEKVNSTTAQQTVLNIKPKEKLIASTKEKSDIKCEDSEYTEKE